MSVDLNHFVVHCQQAQHYDVYIGRGSPWGNPFVIGEHGTRAEVIAKYEESIKSRPGMLQRIRTELRGKILGCWCAPKPCHGDVLARIANED